MSKTSYSIKLRIQNSRLAKLIRRFWYWKNNISKLKYLLFIYLLIILVSSLILFSPIAQNPEAARVKYIDAFFTTASAFSDTGLVTVDTFSQWNDLGQAIIAILILAGGIGIFALKFFAINYLFGKKTSTLAEIKIMQTERGVSDVTQTTKLIISSVKFIFICICLFSVILTFYFYFATPKHTEGMKQILTDGSFKNPQGNFVLSLKYGIFHTISAINNAGFDIMSSSSLMPYYQNYFLQICFIILLIIGGLGYPALHDIVSYIKRKLRRKDTQFKFSIFTKVSLTTYVIVFLIGFGISLGFELSSSNPYSLWNQYHLPVGVGNETHKAYIEWFSKGANVQDLELEKFSNLKQYIEKGQLYGNTFDKFFAVFFTSLSTRSAGFATVNMKHFTHGSTFVFIFMMIIGSAPASTGGGIRTTTLALIILGLYRILFGRPRVRVFKRAINQDTVNMSAKILTIATIIILIASMILFSSFQDYGGKIENAFLQDPNEGFSMENLIFEVASAFGTTGLSSGITKNLNIVSKLTLIIVMFIGQFGISSTLNVWKRKKDFSRTYEYVEADIIIG
ncbi:potassium transporter TrkG [Mycoplasma sp. 2045]|uniref:potassium transporter TrkG n=1 Tax=Mycoplasma sp. 2045 TaxID=2967301 RepID=UPI003593CA6B